ncbi:uncharacterized protein EC844_11078 [Acinetobacter calcoaceticus]|uniref:DUF418 domain-containing protein n=1 Tax=Acinetobacter calcoaceticus TaxID=471 RepID=A0A4R1XRR6_ACICA|nr:uncharacterized protein EC844_11078 [Acinetobacter calcoaceticus]
MLTTTLNRQPVLDILRGFALFGILMVNIGHFSSAYWGFELINPMQNSRFELLVAFLITVFFDSKFYLIFAFLFGYGFSLQLNTADRQQQSFMPIYFRRILGLFVIGSIHALLLSRGDILMFYAVLAIPLYFIRQWSDLKLLKCALFFIVVPNIFWAVLNGLYYPQIDQSMRIYEIEWIEYLALGGWSELITLHWVELELLWLDVMMAQGSVAFAMFCIGLVAGRRQLFLHLERYQPYLPMLLYAGFGLGLPIAVVLGYSVHLQDNFSLRLIIWNFSVWSSPLLAATYMLIIIKLYQTGRLSIIMNLLASAGRMALTNYILQSVICTYIFFGVGLGWMGQVTPSQTVLIVVTIFISQCLLSQIWLRYFRYGPLEWLLRSLTHLKFPSPRGEG